VFWGKYFIFRRFGMKKMLMIATIAAMMGASANAGMSYECWTYVNGHPDKMINVVANNQSEAESKAWDKFKELGITPTAVKCK
jgi:hypothetical protein